MCVCMCVDVCVCVHVCVCTCVCVHVCGGEVDLHLWNMDTNPHVLVYVKHSTLINEPPCIGSTKFLSPISRQTFAKAFNSTPDDLDMHIIYDVSHNIAKVEEHISYHKNFDFSSMYVCMYVFMCGSPV